MWTNRGKTIILFERTWRVPNVTNPLQKIPLSTQVFLLGHLMQGYSEEVWEMIRGTLEKPGKGMETARLYYETAWTIGETPKILHDRHKRKWISGKMILRRFREGGWLIFEQKHKITELLHTRTLVKLRTKRRPGKWEKRAESELLKIIAESPETLFRPDERLSMYGLSDRLAALFVCWWKAKWLTVNGKV